MTDTTVIKINSNFSPSDGQGKTYLASGKSVAMRLWREHASDGGHASRRDYETVGYVIAGRAELEIEGQKVLLEAGDSGVVPKGSEHRYLVTEDFTAVEAPAPPAQVHGRDE